MLTSECHGFKKRKQVSGISPNVVHSWDAAHMMHTALKCRDAGITGLAMVHDSYATTPGEVDVLGVLLPSFLLGGKQPLGRGANGKQPTRTYGMSVTEPCLDWSATADALERLAAAVRQRRAAAASSSAKKARTR